MGVDSRRSHYAAPIMPAPYMIGIMLSVVASTLSCVGVNTQKVSHVRKAHPESTFGCLPPLPPRSLWWCGMALIMSGSVCDFISYGFADVSLLAPLGSLTMLTNMAVAPCLVQGEKLTRWDVLCTVIIFSGVVVAILFGSKNSTKYTLDDLLALFNQTAVYAYLGCVVALGAVVKVLFVRYSQSLEDMTPTERASFNERTTTSGSMRSQNRTQSPGSINGSSINGSRMSIGNEDMDIVDLKHANVDLQYRMLRFLLPLLAGTFGSISALCGKSLAEIGSQVFGETKEYDVLEQWQPYVILVSMAFCLVSQVKVLNVALSMATALYVVPVYQVMWSIMNITVGMVYFDDFSNMDTVQLAVFPCGILIIVLGMYLLSHPPKDTKDTVCVEVVDGVAVVLLDGYESSSQAELSEDGDTYSPMGIDTRSSDQDRNKHTKIKRQSVLLAGGMRTSMIPSSVMTAVQTKAATRRKTLNMRNHSRVSFNDTSLRQQLLDDTRGSPKKRGYDAVMTP